MPKKTFKIGERCKGGIITIETKGNKFAIIGKEWDYSKGRNQSRAKEWTRLEVDADVLDQRRKAVFFLQDLTSSYYADEIMKWIETKGKIKFNTDSFW